MNGSLLSECGLQTTAAVPGSQFEGQMPRLQPALVNQNLRECVCVCVCVGGQVLCSASSLCFSVSLRMVGPDQLMPGDPSQMERPKSPFSL